MTTPQDSSLSTNNNAPTEQEDHPITTVVSRLKDAGLGTKCFLPIETGGKGTNQAHDCVSAGKVRDNDIYGVYAKKNDDLVIVDIDCYRDDDVPESVENLPATFIVRSPHCGRHRYYSATEDITGSRWNWGEVRATNQYVVGPGSKIEECTKEWHDCSQPDEGRYEIIDDRPISAIDAETIKKLASKKSNSGTNDQTPKNNSQILPTGNDTTQAEHEFSIEKRGKKMMNSKQGNKIEKLWKGRYQEAGYKDRSTAEAALVSYLGFWMGGNKHVVRRLMNEACEEHPEADINGQRKWIEAREGYRNKTLKLAKHLHYYQPETSTKSYEERPEVSWVTENRVFGALLRIGTASTNEIATHDLVDRGSRQVLNCLNKLIEREVIVTKQDGRNRYYKIAYSNS